MDLDISNSGTVTARLHLRLDGALSRSYDSLMFFLTSAVVALTGSCVAVDGYTLRCGRERIRLTGIVVPRPRDPDSKMSQEALREAIRRGPLSIRRITRDRHGRTVAVVYAGQTNLSCNQIFLGDAYYVRQRDIDGIVAQDCPVVSEPAEM
jgi:endonuclease YncB( thermonuclease family)